MPIKTSLAENSNILEAWIFQKGQFVSINDYVSCLELKSGVSIVICTYMRPESLATCLLSLAEQTLRPSELIVVDASTDDATKQTLIELIGHNSLAEQIIYVHVQGSLRGLTRQRNLGLELVSYELTAFFDDDVVLEQDCLQRMAATHRELGAKVVGVAGYIKQWGIKPSLRWRLRRFLRLISTSEPGSYVRPGIAVPWAFLPPQNSIVYGDVLPGGATMWKTHIACQVRFEESLIGYAHSEDVDFSLRIKSYGALALDSNARLDHLHAEAGRPNIKEKSYMEIYNRYLTARTHFVPWTRGDQAHFILFWILDTLLLLHHIFIPRRRAELGATITGRLKGLRQLFREGI